MLSAAEGRTRRDYDDATRELRRTLNLLCAGALAGVFDGPSTTTLDLAAPGISVDISATAAAGDTLVAAAMLATWAAGFGTVDAATALADAGLAPPRRHLMVMDELWRALRGAPGLVEHADALTRLNRSRGIASLMITHSLADLDALPTRADVAKARGFVERSAIVALGGLPPRELDRRHPGRPPHRREADLVCLLELRRVLAARRPAPRTRQLPAQDRATPRAAAGHGTHRRRDRPLRHRHPHPEGELMRPAPLGPRAGMPPEMATPLAIVATLWGGLALAGVGWATGSAAGWAATGRWDPPPFAVDTATRVLREGPGPVFTAPTTLVAGSWIVLGVAACVAGGLWAARGTRRPLSDDPVRSLARPADLATLIPEPAAPTSPRPAPQPPDRRSGPGRGHRAGARPAAAGRPRAAGFMGGRRAVHHGPPGRQDHEPGRPDGPRRPGRGHRHLQQSRPAHGHPRPATRSRHLLGVRPPRHRPQPPPVHLQPAGRREHRGPRRPPGHALRPGDQGHHPSRRRRLLDQCRDRPAHRPAAGRRAGRP